jgi:hypothetical protein
LQILNALRAPIVLGSFNTQNGHLYIIISW